MTAHSTSRDTLDRMNLACVGSDSRTSAPRSVRPLNSSTGPGPFRSFGRRPQSRPMLQNGMAELLTDIEGLPVLVRLVVQDAPAEARSGVVYTEADIHSLLSSTLEKMVERMCGSPPRRDDLAKQPIAIVGMPALPNETVLRVGPLELDLIDRTAKRGDRLIDLRPREFQLLKYMMQRTDELLTRATLLKDVWRYKFVPETNLVDVHMGRLRRKVDGSHETHLIRNVRGIGFVLSATPFPQGSPPKPAE
jgi:DNA-binding winged helix-turn-helix (wHTH) protein